MTLAAGLAEPEPLPESDIKIDDTPQPGHIDGVSEPVVVPVEAPTEQAEPDSAEPVDEVAELRKKLEEERRTANGRLGAIAEQREELRQMREQLDKLNEGLNKTEAEPEPDKSENPADWLDHRAEERAGVIDTRLTALEKAEQEKRGQEQLATLQAALVSKVQHETGGDEARSAEYDSQLTHVKGVYRDMAIAQGMQPAQADAAVEVMALKVGAQAMQEGKALTDVVKEYATKAGWKPSEQPVPDKPAQDPVNPLLAQEPVRKPSTGVRISLGNLQGAAGSRRITLDQLENASDDVYQALFANDGAKWKEIHTHKYTFL